MVVSYKKRVSRTQYVLRELSRKRRAHEASTSTITEAPKSSAPLGLIAYLLAGKRHTSKPK